MKLILGFVLILSFMVSCSYRPDSVRGGRSEKWEVENGDSILYKYNPDGTLVASYTLKNKLKVGPCKSYYPNGKVKVCTDYKDGMKHGMSYYYYEDGTLFRETEYKFMDMDGLRKIYFKSGKLQAEIPYRDDYVIPGTREWKEDGTEVKHDYKILVSEKDNTAFSNEFVVTLRLNDKKKKVSFYEDKFDSGYFEDFEKITTKANVGTKTYKVNKGDFIMRKAKYYASIKSKMGNPIVIEKVHNLYVEN
jgi:hypothetical protein